MFSKIRYLTRIAAVRTGVQSSFHQSNYPSLARNYCSVLMANSENVKGTEESSSSPPDHPETNKDGPDVTSDSVNSSNNNDVEIVDVDIDKMTLDDDYVPDYKPPPSCPSVTTTPDVNGNAMTAPIDIDPWVDEMLAVEGTVHFDNVAKLEKEEIIYPDPPADRDGYYEFKGIKIWLPKRLLSPGTFRYCMDVNTKQFTDDDMRICRFEKSINEADPH